MRLKDVTGASGGNLGLRQSFICEVVGCSCFVAFHHEKELRGQIVVDLLPSKEEMAGLFYALVTALL